MRHPYACAHLAGKPFSMKAERAANCHETTAIPFTLEVSDSFFMACFVRSKAESDQAELRADKEKAEAEVRRLSALLLESSSPQKYEREKVRLVI